MYVIPDNVTVISYDIWNTLLSGNKSIGLARMRCIGEYFGLTASPEELLEAYRTADRELNHASDTTGVDYGLADRMERISDLLGLDLGRPNTTSVTDIQCRLGELRRQPEHLPSLIEPDLLDTLALQSAAGYKLTLLSNTGMDNGAAMRPTLTALGILQAVNHAVFSSDEGVAKPNPVIFQKMAAVMGVELHEVLHIGDNRLADFEGARDAGCQPLLYAPEGSDLPHIRSLKELILPGAA